uniref:Uncharacterized protein n=1 Tax=Anguilla anguilla TaxID=7936 RepID=A0A0E9S971_ANGAN
MGSIFLIPVNVQG